MSSSGCVERVLDGLNGILVCLPTMHASHGDAGSGPMSLKLSAALTRSSSRSDLILTCPNRACHRDVKVPLRQNADPLFGCLDGTYIATLSLKAISSQRLSSK